MEQTLYLNIEKIVNINDRSEEKSDRKFVDVNISIVTESSLNNNKVCFLFKEASLKNKRTKYLHLDVFKSGSQE